MRYYPLFLDLTGRIAVVVGGGTVAERKIRQLLDAGADVRVISPVATRRVKAWHRARRLRWQRRRYRRGDLRGAWLVIAASDDVTVNQRVSDDARRVRIHVNVIDDPKISTAIAPAMFRRGDLVVAISTGGKSPALAQQLRKQLSREFGRDYAAYVKLLGRVRRQIMQRVLHAAKRRRLLHRLVRSNLLPLVKKGHTRALARRIARLTK